MSKNLVIVESPAKAKTIKKFLGRNYKVMASNGHVRDLPKSQLGVDVDNDFEPKYITIRGKGPLLAELRKEAKKAEKVYLATDPDREGEAISWHLSAALKLDQDKYSRITFNEITKDAVKNSIKQARDIDMDLVDAQQARRALDRIVGYKISPVLWNKVKRGLSAGRVQSVALRLICDREEEINSFIPKEYWNLEAVLDVEGSGEQLTVKFLGDKDGNAIEIQSKDQLDNILEEIEGEDFVISELKKSTRSRKAPLPFTTSTLQQEASKTLNFSTSKTMRIAQQLYESVDIKGHGSVGLITYLRTDSTRISESADASVREYIKDNYGSEYVISGNPNASKGKNSQDAHEAIRPTSVDFAPSEIKDSLSRDQYRLYKLIWERFVASRMQPAKYETISIKVNANGYRFSASTSKLVFQGFLSIYKQEKEEELSNQVLASMTKDTTLTFNKINYSKHFTKPPAHYNEASLVKTLEELGIGRPSTYAPTITTLISRRYITKEEKNLYVTELGEIVNDIMLKAFPTIVDVNFTANLESLLDAVEEGKINWKTIIRNFYPDLESSVESAEKNLEKIEIADEETDIPCDLCGRNMVIKYGPHGKFLGCPGFPECRNTKPYLEKIGVACPKCGKDIVIRKTKKGRKYYGCEDNPECDFMSWQKPSKHTCPSCQGYMLEKGKNIVCHDEECGYQISKEELEDKLEKSDDKNKES